MPLLVSYPRKVQAESMLALVQLPEQTWTHICQTEHKSVSSSLNIECWNKSTYPYGQLHISGYQLHPLLGVGNMCQILQADNTHINVPTRAVVPCTAASAGIDAAAACIAIANPYKQKERYQLNEDLRNLPPSTNLISHIQNTNSMQDIYYKHSLKNWYCIRKLGWCYNTDTQKLLNLKSMIQQITQLDC